MTSLATTDFRVLCPVGTGPVAVSARLYRTPAEPTAWLILAHGAGAGHDHAFMVSFARALALRGLAVVTFNFPYIERGRRVPDPRATLEACWTAVIASVRDRAGAAASIVAGGKSMGGRIASQVAADDDISPEIAGLVFLGYPLHPPGRPAERRSSHWPRVRVPALFVQGSRDSFATPVELREELAHFGGPSTVVVVDGGDHSFKVPHSSGLTQDAVYEEVERTVADWTARITASR